MATESREGRIVQYEPPTAMLYPSQQEWKLMGEVARTIFASKQFKNVSSAEAAVTVILAGRELGLPPMFSLKHINFIENQPTLDGAGMLALLRKHGIKYKIEEGDGWASCTIERDGTVFTETFTRDRAKKAGLLSKNNWQKYEKEMLRWRAISGAAKIQCPDITGGLLLSEELGAEVDAEGNVLSVAAEVVETSTMPSEATEKPTGAISGNDQGQDRAEAEKPSEGQKTALGGESADTKELARRVHIAWSERMKNISVALGQKIPGIVQQRALYLLLKRAGVEPVVNGDNKVHLSGLSPEDIKGARIAVTDPTRFEWTKVLVEALLKKHWGETKDNAGEEATETEVQSQDVEKEKGEEKEEEEEEEKQDVEKLTKEVRTLQEHIEKLAGGFKGARLCLKIMHDAGLTTHDDLTAENLVTAKTRLLNAYTRLSMGEDIEDVAKDFETAE